MGKFTNKSNMIAAIILAATCIGNLAAYFFLPDMLVMQITAGGEAGTTMPTAIATGFVNQPSDIVPRPVNLERGSPDKSGLPLHYFVSTAFVRRQTIPSGCKMLQKQQ